MGSRKAVMLLTLVMLALALAACGGPSAAPAPSSSGGEIAIGSLNDLTGATSDVGKDYALGVQEAIRYVNENGGINGKQIKLSLYDYGYLVPGAVTTYKRFRDSDKVVAVLGWGTNDTVALAPTVSQDKMPYVSASYAGELTDPSKTPYNFFASPDYSTAARAAITTWYEEVWLKDARFAADRSAGTKPRFVAFYGKATPYASAPIKAIKEQAQLLGFEIGPDQDIPLTALDTKSQVLAAKEFKPHLVWHGDTVNGVATALKDAKALGLGADNIVNTYGFDENLPKLVGDAAEGVMGIAPSAFYGENVPGMDTIVAAAKKYDPNTPQESRTIHTVKAWANVTILKNALIAADKAGKLNGEGILAAFETFKDLDIGMGVAPMTWTPADHRPTSIVNIYQIKGGKFVKVKSIDMKAKYADQWSKWIGY